MSRSFRESLRLVAENTAALKKNSMGMTPDAQKFKAIHKVEDPGMKHLVQKDSETADYEKMFKADNKVAPTRLADQDGDESAKNYEKANEEVELEEAKKKDDKDDKHDDDCSCDDCSSESDDIKEETVSEIYAVPGTPAGDAYNKQFSGNAGKPALPLQANQKPSFSDRGIRKPVTPYVAPSTGAPQMAPGTKLNKPTGKIDTFSGQRNIGAKPVTPTGNPNMAGAKLNPKPASVTPTGNPNMAGAKTNTPSVPEPKVKPVKPAAQSGALNKSATNSNAITAKKPVAPAPVKKKETNFQRQNRMSNAGRNAVAGPVNQSFEIELNGKSYLMNEAQFAAINAFVEKHGELNEKLGSKASKDEYIKDFVKSKDSRFEGDSPEKRAERAVAAFYHSKKKK